MKNGRHDLTKAAFPDHPERAHASILRVGPRSSLKALANASTCLYNRPVTLVESPSFASLGSSQMPFIRATLVENALTRDQKQELISRITDVVASFYGEHMRSNIWVV